MSIEALSEEERETLGEHPACMLSGPKAIRIIDRDAATLARVRDAVKRAGRMWPPGEQVGLDRCVELVTEALAGVGAPEVDLSHGAHQSREELERNVDAWAGKCAVAERDLAAANARNAELERELQTFRDYALKVEHERDLANVWLASFKSGRKTMKDDLAAANARVAELEAQKDPFFLTNEVNETRRLLAAANARADAAELRVIEYQACYAARESEAAQWKAKCEMAEQETQHQMGQLRFAEAAYQRKLAERQRAESEAASLRQEKVLLEDRVAVAQGMKSDAQAEAAALRDTNAMLMGQLQQSRETVASLRAELNELKARIAGTTTAKQALTLTAANAKIDALRADVERLRAEAGDPRLADDYGCPSNPITRLEAAEARLAAATELLGRVDARQVVDAAGVRAYWLERDIDAFLANAPAVPTRPECGFGICGTVTECADCGRAPGKGPARKALTRTDHERAVLEACKALNIDDLVEDGEVYIDECRALECDDQARLVRAVLAWREGSR